MVRIYYSKIAKEKHERLLHEWLPGQPPAFREKIMRYRRWQDAQLSLLGRMILNKGLRDAGAGPVGELKYTQYGKPYLGNSSIRFNISHSGDLAICALVDGQDIGIDIELVTPVEMEEFKPQMTGLEWDRVNTSSDKLTAFYKYWTEKEALIKANGKGLHLPLRSFEVIDNQTKINGENYYLKEIFIDKCYVCSIASNLNLHHTSVGSAEVVY